MSQLHDAALLHHRAGRYNNILRSLMHHTRMRHCSAALFRAWASWSRTNSAAKSRCADRVCRSIARAFTSWRVIALWRIRIEAAIAQSLTGRYSRPLNDASGDVKSKASVLASSVVSIVISHPFSWPNVAAIRRATDHQRLLFSSLSVNVCFDSCVFSSPLKQTVKSLFQMALSVCMLSDFFRSWNHFVARISNRRSKNELLLLDGGISDVIAGACVSVGRSCPQLLGYCALKVRKRSCSELPWLISNHYHPGHFVSSPI